MPATGALAGELAALLTIETLPLTRPEAVGANVTLKLVFCPAAIVTGRESPLILNCGCGVVIWETVTLDEPVFVRITGRVLRLPSTTSRKSVLAGLTEREAWTPVPETGAMAGEFRALLTIERLPLILPAAVGANATPKLVVCPAANVTGKARPLKVNCCGETVASETVKLPVPLLVRVTEIVFRLPTPTLPKFIVAGLTESAA